MTPAQKIKRSMSLIKQLQSTQDPVELISLLNKHANTKRTT